VAAVKVYPAIDLLDGSVVRLREGRRDSAVVYSRAPDEVARRFAAAGATRLHVVDLDGAFSGNARNLGALERIRAVAPVQFGGGVRDEATLRRLLDLGVDRVVVGTLAARDGDAFFRLAPSLLARTVVAVDARDGRVAVAGWQEATALDAFDLATRAVEAGCAAVLFTDIARDGTGAGAAVEATARLARALHPAEVIASGGVAALADLRALALAGVPACVVGRALYEGAFTVEEAIVAAGAQ